jgi:enamine deaminase RidA (YjgF/YER057c/UK114 family)
MRLEPSQVRVSMSRRHRRPALERGSPCAQYAGADHPVQLVDQTVGQQVVPERVAAEDQDVAALPALELGDLLVRVGAANDAGVVPWRGLVSSQAVRDELLRPEGLFASPAFSHVAVVPPGATTVYVGGQNAVDQNGELVGGTDVAAQTGQVMANLATALQAAGAGIEHLVSVFVMLVEGVDVQAAYAAAAATLGSAKAPPLVSAAIVSGLGVPGAMVEVSAIAALPDRAPTD